MFQLNNYFLSFDTKPQNYVYVICIQKRKVKVTKNYESNVEMMANLMTVAKQSKGNLRIIVKTVHTNYNISYHKSIIMRQKYNINIINSSEHYTVMWAKNARNSCFSLLCCLSDESTWQIDTFLTQLKSQWNFSYSNFENYKQRKNIISSDFRLTLYYYYNYYTIYY